MNKKILAFDMDGTLVDLMSVFDRLLLEQYGITPNRANQTEFDLKCCIQLSGNKIHKLIREAIDMVDEIPIYDGVSDFFEYLYSVTHLPIRVITNRPIDSAMKTYELMERITSVPYELIINHHGYDKVKFMNGCSAIIEDRRRNALEIANLKRSSKIAYLIDKPYNQIKNPPERLIRISQFKDIRKFYTGWGYLDTSKNYYYRSERLKMAKHFGFNHISQTVALLYDKYGSSRIVGQIIRESGENVLTDIRRMQKSGIKLDIQLSDRGGFHPRKKAQHLCPCGTKPRHKETVCDECLAEIRLLGASNVQLV